MDIKLMNYGRGGGKTYTLVRWLEKDPKRRFLVSRNLNGQYGVGLHKDNLLSYDTSLTIIKERVSKNNSTEIAFDDFDFKKPNHIHILLVLSYLTNIKTVILATTHEAMETEAAKEAKPFIPGFYLAEETKDSILFKRFPSVVAVGKWRKENGFSVDEKGGLTVEGTIDASTLTGKTIKVEDIQAGSIPIQKAYLNPSDGKLSIEPIQKVKAKDLRLGDWIDGKGAVTGIYPSSLPDEKGLLRVLIKDESWKFDGNMVVAPTALLDVDLTKRK